MFKKKKPATENYSTPVKDLTRQNERAFILSPPFIVMMFLAAIALLAISKLSLFTSGFISLVLEHIASALIVAAAIAYTYEYLLENYRESVFRRLFEEHRESIFEALKVHFLLMPEEVFNLIADIAIQTKQTPTLYEPARETTEYTFAKGIGYFATLIEVRKKEIIQVLSKWIEPRSNDHLKFLGSDFIGYFQLSELAPELRKQANYALDQLTDENISWVLNYVWAYSCCEEIRYTWLGEILCNTEDDRVRKWILYVPLQSPDVEFSIIIKQLLILRGETLSEEILKLAARALAAIERNHKGVGIKIYAEFRNVFLSKIRAATTQYWQDLVSDTNKRPQ